MIAFIRGQVRRITKNWIVETASGLGYRVWIPQREDYRTITLGQDVVLYTYSVQKEDTFDIYGFLDPEECLTFETLLSANGVGPKTALSILSGASHWQVRLAIREENLSFFKQIPGVGKKTAERILVDLRDKFSQLGGQESETIHAPNTMSTAFRDAQQALLSLGFAEIQISKVLKRLMQQKESTSPVLRSEEVVKQALKEIHG